MSRDDATLLQIVEAARLVLEFVKDHDRGSFAADARTRSAVLYQLLVIGEAAKRLSEPFRQQHPGVPWSAAARLRDKVIHGYDVVDVDQVWQTAQADIPVLLTDLEPLVPRE